MKIKFYKNNEDDTSLLCHSCGTSMSLHDNDYTEKSLVCCEQCTMCVAVVNASTYTIVDALDELPDDDDSSLTYDLMYIYRMINFENITDDDLFIEDEDMSCNLEKILSGELINIHYIEENLKNTLFMKNLFDRHGVIVNDFTNAGALKYNPNYNLLWAGVYLFEVEEVLGNRTYVSLYES
jgi:hypothetical protein